MEHLASSAFCFIFLFFVNIANFSFGGKWTSHGLNPQPLIRVGNEIVTLLL